MKSTVIYISFMFMLVIACKHDVIDPGPEVSFKKDILPITVGNCSAVGCHPAGGGVGGAYGGDKNDFGLTDYAGVSSKVKPGNPEDSELYEAITDDGDDLMPLPPAQPLNAKQIDLIRLWILQGAKNN